MSDGIDPEVLSEYGLTDTVGLSNEERAALEQQNAVEVEDSLDLQLRRVDWEHGSRLERVAALQQNSAPFFDTIAKGTEVLLDVLLPYAAPPVPCVTPSPPGITAVDTTMSWWAVAKVRLILWLRRVIKGVNVEQ